MRILIILQFILALVFSFSLWKNSNSKNGFKGLAILILISMSLICGFMMYLSLTFE